MRLLITALALLVPLVCNAQMRAAGAFFKNAATSSASYSPISLPNATSISWWKASDYVTNTTPAIQDSGPAGYPLTNLSTATHWPQSGGLLNGHKTLDMKKVGGSSGYLRSVNYTSPQPHTVCLILSNVVYVSSYFFDGATGSGARNYYIQTADLQPVTTQIGAGSGYNSKLITNQWTLVECLFTNGGSRVWTNGVPTGNAGNAGVANCGGFTLGANYNTEGSNPLWTFAEAMTYGSVFTEADRNYLSNYVREKYGAGNVVP